MEIYEVDYFLSVFCRLSGLHLTYYVYLNEFVDPKTKEIMTVISGGASAFGNIILPGK